jgi:hypothetical protein
MRGSVILPKRASSPSTKAGGVRCGPAAAPGRSSWSAPHPNPLPPASEGPEALVDRADTPSFGKKEPALAPGE